jgi:glutamate-1-semialdehyde aminotransferase
MQNIAQNYLTASKHASQLLKTQPKRVVNGGEHEVLTEQGRKTDFVCGLGANLIGYRNTYSLHTPWAQELAEKLCKIFPCIDKIKILKTGSDACSASVRIARAYKENFKTRNAIYGIGCGYHGWGNTFGDKAGIVYENYRQVENFERLLKYLNTHKYIDFCIIEPLELDYSQKTIKQLKEIRRVCNEKKIVLIFDEIITGFRCPGYSVSNYTGIMPDLICLGKALGNGYPISIVGGRMEIMETPGYFISGTFFDDEQAILEALKTLDFLTEKKLENLWCIGEKFQKTFNSINPEVQLRGLPTRAVWEGKNKYKFWQEMNKKGYLLGKAWFLNFNHNEEILNNFINLARKILPTLDKVKLIGDEPTPIFKRND